MQGDNSTLFISFLAVFTTLLLMGCASEQPKRELQAQQSIPVDFTGSWEMDYGHSDNVDSKLGSIYREFQRRAERQAQSRGRDRAVIGNSGLDLNQQMSAIIDAARFADYITDSQILTIEQGAMDIRVERENSFTLDCRFFETQREFEHEELGAQICGWDGHQLVFVVDLPDGTRISHRLTLGAKGERLHVATSVSAGGKNSAFTLNRAYYRFEPLPEDYSCEYTLTRGNVCTRTSS